MPLPDPAVALAEPRPAAIPVTVLTGFLGSGKTTLLRRALRDHDLQDTAVVVNEWGEIGLDHHLVATADDRTVLLANGCLCCSLRSDLVETLMDLLARSARGALPAFRRVVVETTGLADPAPVLQSFMTDPLRFSRFRLSQVVTAVDGLLGADTLDRHDLSLRQAALADRLLLTKADLAGPAALASLEARLRTLNPGAPVERTRLGTSPSAWWEGPQREAERVGGWLASHEARRTHNHAEALSALCLEHDRPLSWSRFQAAATALVQDGRVLRLKGLVQVEGETGPILVNGVQHLFHQVEYLEAWPDGRPRTRLVLIGSELERDAAARRLFDLSPVAAAG